MSEMHLLSGAQFQRDRVRWGEFLSTCPLTLIDKDMLLL